MTPRQYYLDQCAKGVVFEDPQQLIAIEQFQILYQQLLAEHKKKSSFFSFLRKAKLIKGIYLWGGVGIGKTFLMDCFYQSLPFHQKMRMHFHLFMQQVHRSLTSHQGKKDPLQIIAKDIARKVLVICFDELFVSDITDAMLLGRLFKALFAQGVCLVATSNTAPDELYKNGLQRRQFLPTIALLKEKLTVIHLASTIDYRLRHLKEAGVFYTPLNQKAKENMERGFTALTANEEVLQTPIEIYGRQIHVRKRTKDVIWFNFSDICRVPRSQNDYLVLANQYHTVFISDIPVIDEAEKDTICLFINMIDIFYDARVRLVISAAEAVPQLYNRGHLILEYARTHSRLLEMQSVDYFAGEFGQVLE